MINFNHRSTGGMPTVIMNRTRVWLRQTNYVHSFISCGKWCHFSFVAGRRCPRRWFEELVITLDHKFTRINPARRALAPVWAECVFSLIWRARAYTNVTPIAMCGAKILYCACSLNILNTQNTRCLYFWGRFRLQDLYSLLVKSWLRCIYHRHTNTTPTI